MPIYSRNIPAKFQSDPIWNDGALGFIEDVRPNKKKNNNKKNKIYVPVEIRGQFLIQ